mmetsp:Transcript_61607/g.52152  ORF Transcript_61607/g.52152 Transcript_61607/m.52152 type:complete len:96 (+) Transcript_61607:38-325(+)
MALRVARGLATALGMGSAGVVVLQTCGVLGAGQKETVVHTARFQYVGYDPAKDQAIVQYLGSNTASQVPAKEFMETGSAGDYSQLQEIRRKFGRT